MRTLPTLSDRIEAVLAADGSSFVELVRISGLDPATDFRHMRISGVNFSGSQLGGFDFTGTQFENCNFEGADLTNCVLDDSSSPLRIGPIPSAELRDAIDDLLERRPIPAADFRRFPRQSGLLAGVALLRRMAQHELRADVVDVLCDILPPQTLFDAVASAALLLKAFPLADAQAKNITSRRQAVALLTQGLRRARQYSQEVSVLKDLLVGTRSFISALAITAVLAELKAKTNRADRERVASLVHVGVWSKPVGPTKDFEWLYRLFEQTLNRRQPIDRHDFFAMALACRNANQALSVVHLMERAGLALDHRIAEKIAEKTRSLEPRQLLETATHSEGTWAQIREARIMSARTAGEAFAYFRMFAQEGSATASELAQLMRLATIEAAVQRYRDRGRT